MVNTPLKLLLACAGLAAGLLASRTAGGADDGAKGASPALESFSFQDDRKQQRSARARVLVEAVDGGLLIEELDGRLRTIDKERLLERQDLGQPYQRLAADALGKHLQAELGNGFETYSTRHYVIASKAGRPYAQWCGALFERLYAAFQNYWKMRGLPLHEPDGPLVALVFANQQQFAAFATADAGPDVATAKGYYSITTNRIVLYDLTNQGGGGAVSTADINRQLGAAPENIATVIHEATHQIAFNSGLHTRYADNPLWLTEGMAMFFEMPDLNSKKGWKTVGAVNTLRLRQFLQATAGGRQRDALTNLVKSDALFTEAQTAGDAYAEAWALTYFLATTRKDAYVNYLRRISAKPRLIWNTPEQRLAEFQAAFGQDLQKLDAECMKYMQRLGR